MHIYMRPRTFAATILTALALAACVPTYAHAGALQDFSQACDKPNEGQWIAVEGYLRLPDLVTDNRFLDLNLYPDLTFRGKPIGVQMRFGNGPNEAELITSSYRDEDLKVHLADGTVVPFRTKVRVSGKMFFPIEPKNFDCELENPYVEETK